MDIQTLRMVLDTFEHDQSLALDTNLGRRLNVIDLIMYLRAHGNIFNQVGDVAAVGERLDNFQKYLTDLNLRLFDRVRDQICAGGYTHDSLRREFEQYTRAPAQTDTAQIGRTALDALLDGIMELRVEAPFEPLPDPNMIMYVPTPAGVVLEAVASAGLRPDEVFYDIGAGLGRVAIVAQLVSGATVRGVEIDSAHCQQARNYASKLGLSKVSFVNADAREVDYEEGSVFFMYTPFTGKILETVIGKLRQVAEKRPIRLCSYGPCTIMVGAQSWLRSEAEDIYDPYTAVTFFSLPPSEWPPAADSPG
jgi:SAM-dependent methyltransferase